MCNINIIVHRRGHKATLEQQRRIGEAVGVMAFYSRRHNDDGDGCIYAMGKEWRTMKGRRIDEWPASWCIVQHARLATSGKTDANIHPHESESLVLVHNGIFSGLGDAEHSDTARYLALLQQRIDEGLALPDAISATLKATPGSYSIALVDKRTGELWYHKGEGTAMSCIDGKDHIIMSTSADNCAYAAHALGEKEEMGTIKPHRLVRLWPATLEAVAKLKRHKPVYSFIVTEKQETLDDDSTMIPEWRQGLYGPDSRREWEAYEARFFGGGTK
jgi:hypothetical protein